MTIQCNPIARIFVSILIFAALVTVMFGQQRTSGPKLIKTTKSAAAVVTAPGAAVDPVIFDNAHSDCEDLDFLHMNGVGDIRFSHIISNWELRLDFANPNGTFPFTNGGGRVVVGPEDATRSVTIASSSNPATVSSWQSNLPITAVIIKVGTTTYAYPYKPFRLLDADLATGDFLNFRYVSFCFAEPTGVTAADAIIDGRVTDASGVGIGKAQVVVVNGATGESKIAWTSPFGYFAISGLEVNEVYLLNVSHKRFTFEEPQRTIVISDNFTAADFVAQPLE